MDTDESNISNIVLVIDSTLSMNDWLEAVKKSVTELFAIALISGKHISIRFVIFRDYNYLNNSNIIIQDSCNLLDISSELKNIHDTITFLNNVKQIGNSDFQEAIKTGLFNAAQYCNDKTILFLITDAIPHIDLFTEITDNDKRISKCKTLLSADINNNGYKETIALGIHSIWSNIVNIPIFQQLRKAGQLFILTRYNENIDRINFPLHEYLFNYYTKLGTLIIIKYNPYNYIENTNNICNIIIGIYLNLSGNNFSSSHKHIIYSKFDVYIEENPDNVINNENFTYSNSTISRPTRKKVNTYTPSPSNDNNIRLFKQKEFMTFSINTIIDKFRSDTKFQEQVYELMFIIVSEKHIMALTTNNMFGKLWRELNKHRDHPKLKDLQSRMCKVRELSSINGDVHAPQILAEFMEKSYDYSDEIINKFTNVIRVHFETGKDKRYILLLVLSLDNVTGLIDLNVMKEICKGNIFPDAHRQLKKILANLRIVYYYPKQEDIENPHPDDIALFPKINKIPEEPYIPLSLTNEEFYMHIGHIMCPGTLVSLFPACIMAILCYKSENIYIKSKAYNFLQSSKGKWIQLEKFKKDKSLYPELISNSFIKLIMDSAIQDIALTKDEINFYNKYNALIKVRELRKLQCLVNLSWQPTLGNKYSDEIITCKKCKVSRSASIILDDGTCGLCNSFELCKSCGEQQPSAIMFPDGKCGICYEYDYPIMDYGGHDNSKSYLVYCTQDNCRCIYAVEDIKGLKVIPA